MNDKELINQLNLEIDLKNSQLSEIHHKYEELKAKTEKVKKLLIYSKDGDCVGSTAPYNSEHDFCEFEGVLCFRDITINKDCFGYAVPK